jgi:hypothetical protein
MKYTAVEVIALPMEMVPTTIEGWKDGESQELQNYRTTGADTVKADLKLRGSNLNA